MSPLEQTFTFKELIFIIFGLIGAAIYKFLYWVMPKTAILIWDKLQYNLNKGLNEKLEKTNEKINQLTVEITEYRKEKHSIEAELLEVRDAIINDDNEKFEIIRNIYKNQIEKK